MTAKKNKNHVEKEKIIKSALNLAALRGWENITMRDISEDSGVSLADIFYEFEDKADILVALGRMIDREVLSNLSPPDQEASPRERLFDILMDRFDTLNGYREGLISILNSFKCDPKQALISFPHLCKSMTWMLEAAGIDTNGLRGAVKIMGLTGVYLKVLCVWKDDDSADLSKTMAALDKTLSSAENTASIIGL